MHFVTATTCLKKVHKVYVICDLMTMTEVQEEFSERVPALAGAGNWQQSQFKHPECYRVLFLEHIKQLRRADILRDPHKKILCPR